METVIFTCRYFKISWNTTALSQSNCRNFSCSSIKQQIFINHITFESIALLEEQDFSCQERKSRSFLPLKYLNGTSFAVSHQKLRVDTSGWVPIQPFQLKQAILRTDFFLSGIYSFSLFSYLRAFGLNALTHLITVICMNCKTNRYHYVYHVSATSIIWWSPEAKLKAGLSEVSTQLVWVWIKLGFALAAKSNTAITLQIRDKQDIGLTM